MNSANNSKQASPHLELEADRLCGIVEVMKDGVIAIDRRGIISWANPAAEAMFGYTLAEMVGRNVSLLMPPPYAERHDQYLANYLETGEARVIGTGREVLASKKNGETFPAHLTVSEVKRGDEVFFCGIMKDLTEIKKVEEDKARLLEQVALTHKMDALGQLAGGIAHDLNNLLTPIIGFTELSMRAVVNDAQAKANLETVLLAACRGRDIVKQILTFCRVGSLERQACKVGEIVQDALKVLRTSVPSSIEMNYSMRTVEDAAFVDPAQIHQVIMNLGINGVQAMEERGGVLDIWVGRISAVQLRSLVGDLPDLPQEYLQICVSDTGDGMSPEVKMRAVEPFFSTKPKGQGTGLGLAVCHGIVSSHGGQLLIDSLLSMGTSISVFLPASNALPGAVEDSQILPSLPRRQGNVVIIDDERIVLAFAKQALEEHGFSVTAFKSPSRALRYIEAKLNQIDLVITDYSMPEISGTDVVHRLRSLSTTMPVILCSGWWDDNSRIRANEVGVDEFVLKPMSTATLVTTVERLLKRSRSGIGETESTSPRKLSSRCPFRSSEDLQ